MAAWFIGITALLALTSCRGDGAQAPAPGVAYTEAFDDFWSTYDRTYSYFSYKSIDWNAVRMTHRGRANTATTDDALIAVLQDAVGPLRDLHAWFRRPDGTVVPTYVPPGTPNWQQPLWLTYLPRLSWQQGMTNWGYGASGDVGYIAIGAWNPMQVRIAEVESALDQLRSKRALILDVRMNGGGDDALALRIAGRFATSAVTFGSVQFRNGPGHDDFATPIPRVLTPQGPWQYAHPVYLLVGRGCFSSNETFVAAMRELPNVTVIGDTTGGSSGNPAEFPIVVGGRSTGWRYTVPRWIERTADGTVIEWNGVPPDVHVPFDAAAVSQGVDPVLEFALTAAASLQGRR